jgi:hypothetical protein
MEKRHGKCNFQNSPRKQQATVPVSVPRTSVKTTGRMGPIPQKEEVFTLITTPERLFVLAVTHVWRLPTSIVTDSSESIDHRVTSQSSLSRMTVRRATTQDSIPKKNSVRRPFSSNANEGDHR